MSVARSILTLIGALMSYQLDEAVRPPSNSNRPFTVRSTSRTCDQPAARRAARGLPPALLDAA